MAIQNKNNKGQKPCNVWTKDREYSWYRHISETYIEALEYHPLLVIIAELPEDHHGWVYGVK